MQYFYFFANTSLVLRVLNYLSRQIPLRLAAVTVIYLVDRWVLRIQLREPLTADYALDFEAFLRENGYPYAPSPSIAMALNCLDAGRSITDVMNQCHVVVVSHGALRPEDIEDFRNTFVRGLGYCPPSLV